MKRILYKLIFCLAVLPFASCVSEDIVPGATDGAITLELYTGAGASRAVDEPHEYALSHLDVFIFESEGEKKHYERIATNVTPDGTVALSNIKKSDFNSNAGYWVYIIANSSKTVDEMSGIANKDGLMALTQEDSHIHLSGLGLNGVPKYFLMDGVAFKDNTEPQVASAVIINDGTAAGNTVLKVNLRRAAAKVELLLTAGNNVEFYRHNDVGYYLRNMPTVTTLLAGANLSDGAQKLVSTTKTVSDYSNGKYKGITENYEGNGELSIVAYVYAHSWENSDFLTQGTSLIVNIPLKYDADLTDGVDAVHHDQSYYQIELGKDQKFERNHYYKITGTINAPGAEEFSEPVQLSDMEYHALDWTVRELNVGGEAKPVYLKVNKDTLRIYNQSVDETLVFSSSSPIESITIHQAVSGEGESMTGTGKPYFYNKYNVKTELGNGRTGFTYWETNSTNNNNGNGVNITADSKVEGAMSGNITVNSTLPNNKTIRYFYLLIENEDGLKEKVFVEQYPVIYITNQLGWYSYRSDFGSSYVNKGTRNVSISLTGTGNNNNWKWNGGYSYSDTPGAGFWYSKVETERPTSGNDMEIDAYFWNNNDNKTFANIQTSDVSGNNARIYHITVTATSGEYTVGCPRMTEPDAAGLRYTDPGADNAKLVSPSFMIASRLGVVTSTGGNLNRVNDDQRLTIFRNHCANYVEVVQGKDGQSDIVYDDWRLPTEAELKIIMDYQGTNGQNADAIDYLLNGKYYFGAAGPVENDKATSTGTTVRCVRDAY